MSASGEDAGSPEQIWILHLGSTLLTMLRHLYEYIRFWLAPASSAFIDISDACQSCF